MRGCRLPRRPGAAGACAASRRPLQPPASQSWARATAERRPPLPRTAAVERYVSLLCHRVSQLTGLLWDGLGIVQWQSSCVEVLWE